ncbi:MAG: PAS domain-containing sensor histidine kinase [Bacteroidota bacterium]
MKSVNKIFHDTFLRIKARFQLVKEIQDEYSENVDEIREKNYSDDRVKLIVQNISDMVTLVNKQGIIVYNNNAVTRILGYEPEELNGKSMLELVHPDDQERVGNRFTEVLQKEGIGELIEFRFLSKFGNYLLIESVGNIQLNNPAFHAVILISRDITEKRKIEDSIKASEERFRSLIHHISDIITIVSVKGEIIYQSASARQLMGYEENELRKRNFAEIVHPEDFPALMQSFQKLIEKGGVSELAEFRLLDKNGNYFYIEAQATNQLNNPYIKGIVVNSRDISIRKKAEEERKILIQELTKNNSDLKQFSYIVSHNLRAPLTNLTSMIKLLDFSTVSTDRSLKLLNGFKSTTLHLNDTLNDLIEILVIKDNTNIHTENIYFEKALNKIIKSIKILFAETNTVISSDFSSAQFVKFNEPYLESIFQNLITNSIRYRSSDRNPEILIHTEIQGDYTILTYTDNGIGFDINQVKDKIFGLHQKFHHHPESRGIGLYLIHAQITSLGGTISVDSEIDKGTTFKVSFKN